MSFLRNLFRKRRESVEDITADKIIVFGDSHSRAFSLNPNFFPIFIGAGKEHNFINSANAERVTEKVLNVVSSYTRNKLLFCFGEPDTRYYLGYGWYPWKGVKENDFPNFKEEVDKSIKRYEAFLDKVSEVSVGKIMVFNVTPSIRTEQNEIVTYFNMKLKELCNKNGFFFIDINDLVYSPRESVIKEEYYADTVHLNSKIQLLVEDCLLKEKLIQKAGYNAQSDYTHKGIQKKYRYNKKFGCYTLD